MQAYARRAQMTSWLTLFAQTGLHPSRRPTCVPVIDLRDGRWAALEIKLGEAKVPDGIRNIERLRETDLRDRRKNGISGNDVHRPAAGSQGGFARRNSPE